MTVKVIKITKAALGFKRGNMLRISIGIERQTFDEIAELARKHETSFSNQVRIMIERGLISSEDY